MFAVLQDKLDRVNNVMQENVSGARVVKAYVKVFQMVSRGAASGKRIKEILECEPSIADGSFDGNTAVRGKVEFRDVSFSYAGMAGERVIDHINLTISPGETFGILGATGCGFYRRDGPGQDHRERQS